jgi:cardiolipin synthase A/B
MLSQVFLASLANFVRSPGSAALVAGSLLLGCAAPAPSEVGDAELAVPGAPACAATDPRPHPVRVVVAPDDGDGPLLALIDGAARSIDMTIYQLSSPRVIGAFEAAARRGVRVRIINDWREAIPGVVDGLRAAGAEVHLSSPSFQHTHQKTVIVDERVAFVFSGNLDNRAFVRGRNYGVIDDDADDVADLVEVFAADWAARAPSVDCTRLVLSPTNARERVLGFLGSATTSLDVEAMYITDRGVESAIVAAKDRGIAVRVLFNDPSHDIGHVENVAARMSAHGIEVKRSGARFLHAKMLLVDHDQAFIGSENFSRPALDENREAGVIVGANDSDVGRITATFEADWTEALPFEAAPPPAAPTSGTDPLP